jgi:hypothetical protein
MQMDLFEPLRTDCEFTMVRPDGGDLAMDSQDLSKTPSKLKLEGKVDMIGL